MSDEVTAYLLKRVKELEDQNRDLMDAVMRRQVEEVFTTPATGLRQTETGRDTPTVPPSSQDTPRPEDEDPGSMSAVVGRIGERVQQITHEVENAVDNDAPRPKPGTLADMTPEEREACIGMWADVDDHDDQFTGVIAMTDNVGVGVYRPTRKHGTACSLDQTTPRTDLPRAWNSDGTPHAGDTR